MKRKLVLKGRGFSSAANAAEIDPALAAEGVRDVDKGLPAGLKPKVFFCP
jgi:hypothetical protein